MIRRRNELDGITHGYVDAMPLVRQGRSICGREDLSRGVHTAAKHLVIDCSHCIAAIKERQGDLERATVAGTGQVLTDQIPAHVLAQYPTRIDVDACGADRRRVWRDHPSGGRYAIFVGVADLPAAIERVAGYDSELLNYSDRPTMDLTTDPCRCGRAQASL